MPKQPKLSWRLSQTHANLLFWTIPTGLTAAGLLSVDVALWYDTLLKTSAVVVLGTLALCGAWELISPRIASPQTRIQFEKTDPPQYAREIVTTSLTMYIVSALLTWVVAQSRRGEPTAFKETLEEASWPAMPRIFYALKLLATLFLSDAWTFWQHFLLHHPSLYVIHKQHHVFHDPSTFAGFALHPFEALWKFCPIMLMCSPALSLYLPVHAPFLLSFGVLNLYLHCGYSIPLLERLLTPLYINTSEWHNKHHQLSVSHFGEMLTLWDWVLGTHTSSWSAAALHKQTRAVAHGKSGFDEQPPMSSSNPKCAGRTVRPTKPAPCKYE